MTNTEKQQKAICLKFGSSFVASKENEKVGIALDTLSKSPLNALRHSPENKTSGWYIWGGEKILQDPDFFKPLHVSHLENKCPELVKYLGLAPGWRVLVAGKYEDVWFDKGILNEKA